MTVNDEIIRILESRRGEFFSGQELAQTLGVSRQAIWKAIKAMKNDGHQIVAKTNLGYSLDIESDIVTASGILSKLNDRNFKIFVMNSCDSTNLVAKRRLQVSPHRNFLVISEEQTGGLGRSGKNFFSPKHSIYMSIVLDFSQQNESMKQFEQQLWQCEQPPLQRKISSNTENCLSNGSEPSLAELCNQKNEISIDSSPTQNNSRANACPIVNPLQITCATAVAVVDAIRKLTNIETKIKWVNDILLNGKKICGILTEGALDFETGQFKNVVIGIGINCNQSVSDFPKELQHIVSSLDFSFPRNDLIAEIVNNVTSNIFNDNGSVMTRYIENSMIIGKNISYQSNGSTLRANVENIDNNGHLIVKNTDGTLQTISSGSVDIDGLYQ